MFTHYLCCLRLFRHILKVDYWPVISEHSRKQFYLRQNSEQMVLRLPSSAHKIGDIILKDHAMIGKIVSLCNSQLLLKDGDGTLERASIRVSRVNFYTNDIELDLCF